MKKNKAAGIITPATKYIKACPSLSGNTGIAQKLFTCLIAGVIIVIEEQYVVVMEERKGEKVLEFITSFPADDQYLKKIRLESGLMEIKKPQS